MPRGFGDLTGDRVDLHRPHVRIDGQGAHELNRHPQHVDLGAPEAAVVEFQRDVPAQDLEEVAETVGAQLVGRGFDRCDGLLTALEQGPQHTRQRGLVHANGQIQVLHAKADQALVGQRPAEVGVASAHEEVDVAGTKRHALVEHILQDGEVGREAQEALHRIQIAEVERDPTGPHFDQLVDGQIHQAVDRTAEHGVDAGEGIGCEAVAQREFEVALEVNEVTDVDLQVGDFNRAGDARDADGQVDVLERVHHALEPVGCAVRDAEVKVQQAAEVDLGNQVAGVGQFKGEIKGGCVDLEQAEQAQVGLEADADFVRIERSHVDAGGAANGNVQSLQASVLHAGEIHKGGGDGVALRHGHVQTKLHILGVQGHPRVGAHQAGVVGLGGDADERDVLQRLTHQARVGDHQTEVQVGDGKADGVRIGRFVVQFVVAVGVGEVRTVDAGERRQVAPANDQGVNADTRHAQARQVHVGFFDDALLERDAAFHGEHVHDVQARIPDGRRQHAFVHVQHDRLAVVAGGNRHARAGAPFGEVGDHARPAALVDADRDVFQRKLDVLFNADKSDLLT